MSDTTKDIEEKLGIGNGAGGVPRWIWYTGGAVLLAVALYFGFSQFGEQKGVRYVTAEAVIGDLKITATATGTIEPTNLVEISSELSGTLAAVYADFNDPVRKGDILAELDTTKLDALLAVSKAGLDSAIARVALANASLEEAKEKYDDVLRLEQRGIVSNQELVSSRAAFVRAQSELQAAVANRALAEAQVDLHQADLDHACICSPIDGIVLDRAVDAGQIVAASLSAPILFTVAEDLTKMELQVDIDEADIGRTAVGNPAVFTVDAYDEREFPAEISEIRFAPKTIDGVVTYKAVLSIDNSDLALRPGMTATAEITVAEITDVLTVPNAAVRYAPPALLEEDEERSGLLGMLIPNDSGAPQRGDDKTIWVMRDGMPLEIPVQTGSSDGRMTEILSGELAAGDLVITDRIDG